MDHIIRRVAKQMLEKLPKHQSHFTVAELKNAGLADILVDRIKVELETNLSETLALPKTDWADMSAQDVHSAWYHFVKTIRRQSRLPQVFAASVMETAVGDVLEQMVEPRKNIPQVIFGMEPSLTFEQLVNQADRVVVYKHLVAAVIRYMERRNLDALPKAKCADVIAQVDIKVTEGYTPLNWAQLMDPWFMFMGHRIDVDLVRRFFQDKGLNQHLKAFEDLEDDINKTELIERLSAPDLRLNLRNLDLESEAAVDMIDQEPSGLEVEETASESVKEDSTPTVQELFSDELTTTPEPKAETPVEAAPEPQKTATIQPKKRIIEEEPAESYYEEFLRLREENKKKWADGMARMKDSPEEEIDVVESETAEKSLADKFLEDESATNPFGSNEEIRSELAEIDTEVERQESTTLNEAFVDDEADSVESETATEANVVDTIEISDAETTTEQVVDDSNIIDTEAVAIEAEPEVVEEPATAEEEDIASMFESKEEAEPEVVEEPATAEEEDIASMFETKKEAEPEVVEEPATAEEEDIASMFETKEEAESEVVEEPATAEEEDIASMFETKEEAEEPATAEEEDIDSMFAAADETVDENDTPFVDEIEGTLGGDIDDEVDGIFADEPENDPRYDSDASSSFVDEAEDDIEDVFPEVDETEEDINGMFADEGEAEDSLATEDFAEEEELDFDELMRQADEAEANSNMSFSASSVSDDLSDIFSDESDDDDLSLAEDDDIESLFGVEDDEPASSNNDLLENTAEFHDYFIKEIFEGSPEAFSSAVQDIESFTQWADASEYIYNDIFSAYNLDMLSEPAIKFIDEVQAYFVNVKEK